jgi:4-hydroxy 2-oxovalerate aldolase
MELIDVTLRESVYYGSGIDKHNALKYLSKNVELISDQDVQYVEIGYLNNDKIEGLNYNEAYISEADEICRTKFKLVAIMHPHLARKELWEKSIIRKLHMVRIVIGSVIPGTINDFIAYFHEQGVKVSVNITYVANMNINHIVDMFHDVKRYAIDCFYCADSSGSCTPGMIKEICDNLIRERGDVKLGLHLHDHLQLSVANALTAMNCGMDIIDTSITGAGKGGGNLKAEIIIPLIRSLYRNGISAKELCNIYDFIGFFNHLICRNGTYWEKAFLDSLTGIFRTSLKRNEIIDASAGNDMHRYIHMIAGEQSV